MANGRGIGQGAIGGAAAGSRFGWGGALAGGALGAATGAFFGDDPARRERERLVKMLEQGGYDPQEMSNYYDQAAAPVEESMADASKSSAASYARRGLGGSGLSDGSQNDIAVKRAAQLRQAKLSAIHQATQDRRRRLLDALGGYGDLSAENQGQFADVMGGLGYGIGMYGAGSAGRMPGGSPYQPPVDLNNLTLQSAYGVK